MVRQETDPGRGSLPLLAAESEQRRGALQRLQAAAAEPSEHDGIVSFILVGNFNR